MSESIPKPSLRAKLYFIWGQSCAYWGNQTLSKRLHQWAVGSWTRALFYAPEWATPLLRRGVIRGRELDDYAGAVRDLTTLIEQHPEWAEPYLQRGLLHSFHGLHAAQRAIDDLETFLSLAAAEHTWRIDAQNLIERLTWQLNERAQKDLKRD